MFRLTSRRTTPSSVCHCHCCRKLLVHYEGIPLHLDMRSVLDEIAESLVGDITVEPAWLSEHAGPPREERGVSAGVGEVPLTDCPRTRPLLPNSS